MRSSHPEAIRKRLRPPIPSRDATREGNDIQRSASFRVEICEPWVVPGPRTEQRPELILVAPSGRIHRKRGEVLPPLSYRMEIVPDEPGLWKYGWCFSPAEESPAAGNRGGGVFYVDATDPSVVENFARALIAEFGDKETADLSDQYRFNAFLRLAAEHRLQSEEQRERADKWIAEVRRLLPHHLDQNRGR